jgi:hypothetical protein
VFSPGGFGSGVRVDFKKSYLFELICLYTNSERVRERQQGLNRLLASNNRLLVRVTRLGDCFLWAAF